MTHEPSKIVASPQAVHVIGSIGGVTAAILGGLYAYGALKKATELHGARLDVTDTLPLVPLEQLLLTGVGSLLSLGGALLVVGTFIFVLTDLGRVAEQRGTRAAQPVSQRAESRMLIIQVATVVVVLLITILFGDWILLLSLAFGGVTFWYGFHVRTADVPVGRAVVAVALVSSVSLLALNYFSPDPLPRATLSTGVLGTTSGELIASTGDHWYLASGDRAVRAIPSRDVKWSRIESCTDQRSKSLWRLVTGRKPFGLPKETPAGPCR